MTFYFKVLIRCAVVITSFAGSGLLFADTEGRVMKAKNSQQVSRIGGNYRVDSIRKIKENIYRITFESLEKTGKYDRLVLESDHVNIGVETGMNIRLSAEVLKEQGAQAEVSQVLLFFPAGDTHVPIWMLSRKVSPRPLRGSKFLEMHAPTSDYFVL